MAQLPGIPGSPHARDGVELSQQVPATLADTRINPELLVDLVARHLADEGLLSLAEITRRLGLAPAVVAELIANMSEQALLDSDDGLHFELSDNGRSHASHALARSNWRGPAPVAVEEYAQHVAANSVRRQSIRRPQVRAAFDGVVVSDEVLDAFGRGLNSDRAMLVCGPAGSGKTYLTQHLVLALSGPVLIPHAIAVGDAIVPVYDPLLHEPYSGTEMEDDGVDRRFGLCRRPGISAAAQLAPEMLDLRFDPVTRSYHAPLQLMANNGVLIIDDVGRQRISPEQLLNRWIVPFETRQDWLMLDNGRCFAVPFDVLMIFVTNCDLDEIGGETFRRYIGHTVRLAPVTRAQYEAIWRHHCQRHRIAFDPQLVRHAVEELHARDGVPLLSCFPGDLLSLMLDQCRYSGDGVDVGAAPLELAWASYFSNRRPAPVGAGMAATAGLTASW